MGTDVGFDAYSAPPVVSTSVGYMNMPPGPSVPLILGTPPLPALL